jgi:uncharacterized membrane protein
MAIFNAKDRAQAAKVERYRRVFFGSQDGKAVLHDIALVCRHFEIPENEDDVVLQNFFKTLLFDCGVLHDGTTEQIIDKYAELEYTRKISVQKEK